MTNSTSPGPEVASEVADSAATSPSLLMGMLNGQQDSWHRFAQVYAPLVYRWGRAAGLQPDDVADVTQEVFRTVAVRIGAFDPSHQKSGAFRSWLWGVTRNKLLQHSTAVKSQPVGFGGSDVHLRLKEVTTPSHDVDESVQSEDNDRRAIVENTLNLLHGTFDDQTWSCFWRLAVKGDTAKEIGADLKMTAKAVRQAKYRVACRLRIELGADFCLE